MTRDVAVTGYGVHTAFGRGAAAVRRGVFTGTPAFAPTTRLDTTPFRTSMAATDRGDPRLAEVLVDCADEAVESAGLRPGTAGATLLGCAGDFTAITRFWRAGGSAVAGRAGGAAGPEPADKHTVDSVPAHQVDRVADRLGLTGPRLAFTNACVASAYAIIHGCRLIASGRVDVAVCGGGYLVEEENFAKFDSGRALAADGAVRPFSADRTGLLLGDGVAVVVLEAADRARGRGIRPLARITGWGVRADAYHIAKPHPRGAGVAAAVGQALRRAGGSRALDYVNAHGTGTPSNDGAETAGLRQVLGERADATPVSSTKGTTGHLLEASGAVELVILLLALVDGVLPPTAGYTTPDPACDLDYVPNQPRQADVRRAMTVNAAFGGVNTAILLERP